MGDVRAIMELNLHFGKLMAGGDVASIFSDEGDQGDEGPQVSK